jgi:hypothetical protein
LGCNTYKIKASLGYQNKKKCSIQHIRIMFMGL